MTPEKQEAILQAAIDTWGVNSQMMMAFGECGEFVALAGRHVQGRLTPEAIIDEIADVTIMMRQMAKIYGLRAVEQRIEYKLLRLQLRIDTCEIAEVIEVSADSKE
jgi:hypothetical protein